MRYSLKAKDILKEYPELAELQPLTDNIPNMDNDKVIRFALLLTDPDSEIFTIKDETKRRKKAAELAGLSKTKYAAFYEPFGYNKYLDRIINCLFIHFNNPMYEDWVTARMAHHDITSAIRMQTNVQDSKVRQEEAQKKALAFEQARKLTRDILEIESRLFNDKGIKRSVERQYTERVVNYAEEFAEDEGIV